MHVEFAIHGAIREAAGRNRFDSEMDHTDAVTVGEALAAALRAVPAVEPLVLDSKGRLRAHVALQRNGEDVRSGAWLETRIENGDRIDLEPSVKGAC